MKLHPLRSARALSLGIVLVALALGCCRAYAEPFMTAPALIDGNAQVRLQDVLKVLVFLCGTLVTAAGTIVALAYWAGARFQQINDDIRALRVEIAQWER